MAFKIFAGGATLPAADLNDYLMEQSIIVCTSGTRPSSPAEGWTIYETDTDLYLMYSGSAWVTALQPGAWTSYTPVVTLSASGSMNLDGTSASRYRRVGRSIRWHGFAKLDAFTGGTGGAMEFTLPVAAEASVNWLVGSAYGYDNSGNVICPGLFQLTSSTQGRVIYMAGTGPTGAGTYFQHDPNLDGSTADSVPWAWAVDDQVLWDVEYEAAS